MSNSFNLGDLARLAQSLLDAKTKGKEFMLEDVHRLTRAAYERYPEDSVIGQVAFTIERMAEKSPTGALISQAKISDIYNNFARPSSESKFREVLGSLLFEELPTTKIASADFVKHNRLDAEVEKEIKLDIDKNLTNTIASVFSDGLVSTAFDSKIAAKGVEYVAAELKSLGFSSAVEVMGGNANSMVYAAHLDTRKGRVTVAIPTQIENGRVLFPSTFVADDHLEELSTSTLAMFVERKAISGNFSVPKTADILSAISVMFGKRDMAAQEFAKLSGNIPNSAEREINPSYTASEVVEDNMVSLNANEISMDSSTLSSEKVAMPSELAHLSRDFEDDVLEAASTFGPAAIRSGKELVASELRAAGFKNAQVKFGSESKQSVVYVAAINTPKGIVQIEVPVEMQATADRNYVPLSPAHFAYDGLVEDFTANKLQRFAGSLQTVSMNTSDASFSYMLLPELKEQILKSASANDYAGCEAALHEIQERFSEEHFKNAIADYHFILSQKSKLNSLPQNKCSKVIKAGHGSIYDRCGHYGVSLDKVITDEGGYCRLKTAVERERLNPVEETGAAISTSKINLT